jgi:hypothetical protein
MFKNQLVLEVKGRKERLYSFHCDTNAPLGEVYDVLHTMFYYTAQKLKEAVPEQETKESEGEECHNEHN